MLLFLGAYLLGAIPFGYIIYQARSGRDIRDEGSGNIGATNVARRAGLLAGLLTLALDFGKGYFAVLAASWLTGTPGWGAMLAGLAAVLGHVFPAYLRFQGGKGVATAAGVFSALAPRSVLLALLLFVLVVALFRYVSLGSIIGVAAVPISMLLLGSPSGPVLLGASVVAALIIARHASNIRRLMAGTEHRLQLRRT